jgi:hypothetical protein
VPDSVPVLAPDWSYAALANRGTWACVGSLEERVLEKGVLGRFQVVIVDLAENSYERERYPTLLPALLLRLQGDRDFRETFSAGGVHVFVRSGTASASSAPASRR